MLCVIRGTWDTDRHENDGLWHCERYLIDAQRSKWRTTDTFQPSRARVGSVTDAGVETRWCQVNSGAMRKNGASGTSRPPPNGTNHAPSSDSQRRAMPTNP